MKYFEAVQEVIQERKTAPDGALLAAALIWGANAIAQAIYSLGDSNETAARIVSSSLDELGTAIERANS